MKQPSLTTRLAQSGVLGAAGEVFARLGFARTRVEDILAVAGIARRTFYKSFSSKEDVLSSVYDFATTELLKAMRSSVSKDPFEMVRHGLDIYLDYHVENAALLRVLVEQAIRSDSPLASARQRFRTDLVRLLDDAVQAKTGEKHDSMLYIALISALEGLSLDLLSAGASPDKVRRAKHTMHLLLDRTMGEQGRSRDER